MKQGLNSAAKAASKTQRERQEDENRQIGERVSELGKYLKINMVRESPTQRDELYRGVYGNREILIGGSLSERHRRILILDLVQLGVVYQGIFDSEPSHYERIMHSYNSRGSRKSLLKG